MSPIWCQRSPPLHLESTLPPFQYAHIYIYAHMHMNQSIYHATSITNCSKFAVDVVAMSLQVADDRLHFRSKLQDYRLHFQFKLQDDRLHFQSELQ